MKPTFTILLLTILACSGHDLAACWNRWPVRLFGSQAVNIQPLLAWWIRQDSSPRPLPTWYHVSGDIIGETPYGWTVRGFIQTNRSSSRAAVFQLRHPPAGERRRFNELNADLARLKIIAGRNGLPRYAVVLDTYQYGDGTKGTDYWQAEPGLHAQAEPIWAALDKIPITGTNYYIDLFAAKIGYLAAGSHREVFDAGNIPGVTQ
ncbi:MAG: hypothetical protein ACLQU4_10455 [Limisphaerales bacterium]